MAEAIGDRLVEGLGMTENSGGLVTATTREDYQPSCEARDLVASVGRPVPDASIRILDAEGQPVPNDGETVGEIVMTTPALLRGYWQNPTATADALRDGWYHSGDLGSIDPAGYVYVSDRRTDLIVSGGMNVYPSEVEQAIISHDGVRDVAVVGALHERWGQTVVAVVVRETGSTLTADDVIEHARTQIASYKKPTRVVFVDELPLTTSLKVKRHEVRRLVESESDDA
jgi:acyl-CoA synthetase (AMP-forming)/AMP-acid ligase II